jgi:hypothetical protein
MWVVVLVLLLGAVLLFMARTARNTVTNNALFSAINKTHAALQQAYPRAEFTIRSAKPSPEARNIVVYVLPKDADSLAAETMADSSLAIAQRLFDAPGFDSLVVALNGVAVRAVPLR